MDKRPGQDTPIAHWRQENSGSMPAGDVYGGGSPTGIAFYENGGFYVADWTDPRVGGHDTQYEAASGIIYRIAPSGFKPSVPQMDLTTVAGEITALKSPAVNVRSLGYQKLKASGAAAYDAVAKVLEDPNPCVAAGAIWLMPYMGQRCPTLAS